jgi:hypothetical protein
MNNLFNSEPEIAQDLQQRYDAWNASNIPPRWETKARR